MKTYKRITITIITLFLLFEINLIPNNILVSKNNSINSNVYGMEYTSIEKGDINQDGKVNIVDYCLMLSAANGEGYSEKNNYTDVNEDGEIDEIDLTSFRNYFFGKTEKVTYIQDAIQSENEKSDIVSKGTCGDSSTWTLNNEGLLTISGSGAIDVEIEGQPWKRELVRKVIISDGITYIGDYSFSACTNMTTISIPDNIIYIGKMAFRNCKNLTNVQCRRNTILPQKINMLNRIDNYAFDECTNLSTVMIPKGVKTIGDRVFNNCSSLSSIDIPDSVNYIGSYVFNCCYSLIKITIPESVSVIGECAFYGCHNITSVNIPGSVKYISRCAFSQCDSLTSIIIPDNVREIGLGAFSGCDNLSSVIMSNSVTEINIMAFDGCVKLTDINIPESVTYIGSYAFRGCRSLKNIMIPDTVTSIGSYVFLGIESINIYGAKGSHIEEYAGISGNDNITFIEL